ncbi:hypothetical protein, partial [Mesorhizobium sp. M2E.F.Ca.ET.219.01.1.1]|uniref:hypothetical protein n=1 Tax=Mesorhizobium sp. M2E.F.Ca.ET.219.01.1.1 TaxID=2500530 RepID=UPI001AEDDC4B
RRADKSISVAVPPVSLDDQPTDAFPPRQDQKRSSLPNVGLALQISHWHRTREVTGFSRWQTIFVIRRD